MKANVDGSMIEGSRAGCSGVIRDNGGRWLQGFSCNLGSCFVVMAELWGIFYALE